MKPILWTLLAAICCSHSFGQDQKEQVIKELKALSEKYTHTPFLSFDAVYRYSTEEKPGVYLDSLSGSFRMSGDRFWCMLDHTQTLYNGEYVVAIYNDDSVMYVSRPPAGTVPANPLISIDSMLNNKHIVYSCSFPRGKKILTLDLEGDPQLRQVRYEVDAKTGLLLKLTQVVNSAQLYSPSVAEKLKAENTFGIVETSFDHYNTRPFGPEVFDIASYIRKEGESYIAVSPYQSYRIFLGNPNL